MGRRRLVPAISRKRVLKPNNRIVILSAILILLFWLGQYGFSILPTLLPPEKGENALWVGLEWVETPLSENEYRQFATQLRAYLIRYLFIMRPGSRRMECPDTG